MEGISLLLGIVMLFGIYRCTDKSSLEIQVEQQKPFTHYGREYICKSTDKQLKIDDLNQKIREVKDK